MTSISNLPKLPEDQYLTIWSQGLDYALSHFDPSVPERNFLWTSDQKVQLPIRITKSGRGSEPPQTLPQMWLETVAKFSNRAALNYQIKPNQWVTLVDWAKSMASEATYAEVNGGSTPFGWSIAKKLVFNNIKKNFGLDECQLFVFSAAPMRESTRAFFMNLYFFLMNCFGMSELSGSGTFTNPPKWKNFRDKEFLRQAVKQSMALKFQSIIQTMKGTEKFAQEEETHSWDISRMKKKKDRLSTAKDLFILEMWEKWIWKETQQLQVEQRSC